jgi:basic amino acid/polyamine antiporter, APA family
MTEQKIELRRVLGLWSAMSIVVGTIIGSGIFLVPRAMIQQVGSPEWVFAVWIFGGLLSLAGALSYAEMAAAIPEAGGEYAFLREAYGPFWGYIYGWTQMWVAKSGSIATLATGFFYYLANFYPQLEQVLFSMALPFGAGGAPLTISYGQLLAMGVILFLAVVNYFGVEVGGDVQVAVTVLKVVLILGIIAVGFSAAGASSSNLRTAVPATGGINAFFAALVAALWAYDGWNNLSMVSSEIRQPQRNLPIALILGTMIVMAIYLVTNLAYFMVLPADAVAQSPRVAAEMMRRAWGDFGASAVSVAAMVSIFAALNGSILSGARVPYAMARDGRFFAAVARVHPRHRTPSVSILLMSGWAAVLVLSGTFEQLFTYVIFASWILYGMTTAGVIVLRRKRPDLHRPYRTLGYPVVPVLFVISSALLLGSTLLQSPWESAKGIGIILLGVPFYWYWNRRGAPRMPRPNREI